MGNFRYNGRSLGSSANNANAVKCTDVQGNASTVQTELNKVNNSELTEERIIGKIGDENVYEKVILKTLNLELSTSFVSTNIEHGITNLKDVISLTCVGRGTAGNYILPYHPSGTDTAATYVHVIDSEKITLYNKSPWNDYTFRFVVQYTKNE